MKLLSQLTPKTILQAIFVFCLLVILGMILGRAGDYLEKDIVQGYIRGAGVWGHLLFAIILLFTFIIAPLTGFPIVVVGIGAFGVLEAIVLTYIVSMVGAVVNFQIARRFGRGAVIKFVGKKGIEKIDKLAEKFGIEMLVVSRLFQGFLFEWISYAAGFTNVTFKIFLLVTLIASTPYFIIIYLYASHVTDLTELFIKIALTNYALVPIPFVYFFYKKLHKKRRERLVKKS